MIGTLLPLFVGIPLVFAGVLALFGGRTVIHAVSLFAVLTASFGSAIALVIEFHSGGAAAHGVGKWPFGIAIPFAADMFNALMLTVTGLLFITCVAFAYAAKEGAQTRYFAPLMLVLLAGVNGALLT